MGLVRVGLLRDGVVVNLLKSQRKSDRILVQAISKVVFKRFFIKVVYKEFYNDYLKVNFIKISNYFTFDLPN